MFFWGGELMSWWAGELVYSGVGRLMRSLFSIATCL